MDTQKPKKKPFWTRISKKTKPDTECLAINMRIGTYGYSEFIIGFIYWDKDYKFWACEGEGEVLENVTHFKPLNEIKKPKPLPDKHD